MHETSSLPQDEMQALMVRCQQLEEENRRLRSILEQHQISFTLESTPDEQDPVPAPVYEDDAQLSFLPTTNEPSTPASPLPQKALTKDSPIADRIALFMSLFHGREDVYAKRYSKANGKTGYTPACRNEWKKGICHKPCGRCPHHSYLPFTEEAVARHLSCDQNDVFGIYAILPDDACWFLAIDLDEEDWFKDVAGIRTICQAHHIPCAVERSRSGNGAHVWFFFSEKIQAEIARRFGSALVTQAMQANAKLSFASYDRMFPNQDTMPKGGFGNLIALPLQPQAAREHGGSLFIDENGNAFPDQWAYLSAIKRMNLTDVETALQVLHVPHPLGDLLAEDKDEEVPWKRQAPEKIPADDSTKVLRCVQADRIYVDTKEVSSRVQNRLKRLVAFSNPKFYQLQKMRKPIWNTPRIICCAEYDGTYLCLPRGCREKIEAFAQEHQIPTEWIDEQCKGHPIRVTFRGSLFEEQKPAFEQLKQHDQGVLSATTAFGKTVIGAALIADKQVNTLILVNSSALLDQWRERLESFLEIHDSPPEVFTKRGEKKVLDVIGQYGNGKKQHSGIIDIAMIQSLKSKEAVPEWIGEYGMVIVDECHHVPAFSFETVLKHVRAKYTYGLSATPKRKDGLHPILNMYLGPIRYRVDAKEQAAKRPFAHVMIPRFTGMTFIPPPEGEQPTIAGYYAQIAEDDLRSHMIVDDIVACVKEGRNCLVLSERVAHVQKLADWIQKQVPHVYLLLGSQSASEAAAQLERVRKAPHDQPIVICATGKYVGEGFDEPRLDTLFLTMPISWEGLLAQYTGRLHRRYDGKKEVRVYDYIDDQAAMLARMYTKRLRGYASLGYEVSAERSDAVVHHDVIYNQKTLIGPFLEDIQTARKSVIICSPYVSDARVQWLYHAIHENQHPIHVTIIARPPQSLQGKSADYAQTAIEHLQGFGAQVICKEAIHQKFAIIDDKIVWFGSVNLLSFGASEENVIRIVTGSVAQTLKNAVQV